MVGTKEKSSGCAADICFSVPPTNEPPASAGSRARQRGFVSDYPYEPSAPSNSRARQRGFVSVPRLSTKGVPFMKRLPAGIISTLLSLTMTLNPWFHVRTGSPRKTAGIFALFFSGPGVAALSSGDEYSEYQWALNNTGRLRRTEKC